MWVSGFTIISGNRYVREANAPGSAASAPVLTVCYTAIPPPPGSALPDSPIYRVVPLSSDGLHVSTVCSTLTSLIPSLPLTPMCLIAAAPWFAGLTFLHSVASKGIKSDTTLASTSGRFRFLVTAMPSPPYVFTESPVACHGGSLSEPMFPVRPVSSLSTEAMVTIYFNFSAFGVTIDTKGTRAQSSYP